MLSHILDFSPRGFSLLNARKIPKNSLENIIIAFESRRALKKDNNKLLQMLQMRYWIFSVGFACVRYLEGICSATKN